jgi:hypothetical protein
MAKGHCKYGITDDEDAELRDFYQSSSSSDAREELLHRELHAMHSSYDAGLPPRAGRGLYHDHQSVLHTDMAVTSQILRSTKHYRP